MHWPVLLGRSGEAASCASTTSQGLIVRRLKQRTTTRWGATISLRRRRRPDLRQEVSRAGVTNPRQERFTDQSLQVQ